MSFTACLIQLNSSDDVSANLQQIAQFLAQAAEKKAMLAVLPENAFYLTGIRNQPVPEMESAVASCQSLAKKYGMWLLIGSVHVPAAEGKYYNRSLLIDPQGAIAASYDKIHLFDVSLKNAESYRESDRIMPGEKAVLAPTPFGALGLTICYDLRFPHLYRLLAKAGAGIITVPAAFTYTTGTAHWHSLLRARAIETGCYILAPAQCGEHPGGRRTYGHSLAVSPWGKILAEGSEDKSGMLPVQIDLIQTAEARTMIPCLTHDRKFTLNGYTATL